MKPKRKDFVIPIPLDAVSGRVGIICVLYNKFYSV